MGGLANRLIQYLAAQQLAQRLRQAGEADPVISNVVIPEFGIHHPYCVHHDTATQCLGEPVLAVTPPPPAGPGADWVIDIRSYAQQMVNLPAPAAASRLIPDTGTLPSTGDDILLCSIRQAEILDARHPDYVLIPPHFYADLAAGSGKRLVFMGQLDDTPYLASLRAACPQAAFWPSAGAIEDFSRLRRARHVVPSISSFAWLATWLGEARSIHLPVLGLFNPRQSPASFLLPQDDARYHFWRFPFHYAVPVAQCAAAHAALQRCWRPIPGAALSPIRPDADRAALLSCFDEAEYLALHRDVAHSVRAGGFPSGLHHFLHHGFHEGRTPFSLDPAFYCTSYPLAALELTLGEYRDPWHHYALAGRARGYLRHAPADPGLSRAG